MVGTQKTIKLFSGPKLIRNMIYRENCLFSCTNVYPLPLPLSVTFTVIHYSYRYPLHLPSSFTFTVILYLRRNPLPLPLSSTSYRYPYFYRYPLPSTLSASVPLFFTLPSFFTFAVTLYLYRYPQPLLSLPLFLPLPFLQPRQHDLAVPLASIQSEIWEVVDPGKKFRFSRKKIPVTFFIRSPQNFSLSS